LTSSGTEVRARPRRPRRRARGIPKGRKGVKAPQSTKRQAVSGMLGSAVGPSRPQVASAGKGEDRDLIIRVGSFEIDWPKSIGYFGGVALAVAYDLIAAPVGLFIAAIPLVKLFKHPGQSWSVRLIADAVEGAAKPVGGDAEATVRLARSTGRGPAPQQTAAPRRPRSARRDLARASGRASRLNRAA
jgi:hypothetical protein